MKNKEKYFNEIVENFINTDMYENCKFRKKYLFKQPVRVCKDDECATCNERLREWLDEECEAEISGEWISIKDGLPDAEIENEMFKITDIVIATDGVMIYFGYFRLRKKDNSIEFYGVDEEEIDPYMYGDGIITHWMPIPSIEGLNNEADKYC